MKALKSIILLLTLISLGGCTTPTRTSTIDDFEPDPGYSTLLRNRNNFMVLKLNLEALNDTTHLPKGINSISVRNTLQNEFERSRRFSVVSPDKADKAGLILNVDANILYSEMATPSKKGFAYTMRMAFTGYNPDGVQDFAMTVKGSKAYEAEMHFTGKFLVDDNIKDDLLMQCIDKCFDTVYPELCRRYPITGNVLGARVNSQGNVIFTVDRDINDGIERGMPFVIGYYDKYDNQIFIAKAKAVAISTNRTSIEVEQWNPREANAVEYAKEMIQGNNKVFIENMFFVSKYIKN